MENKKLLECLTEASNMIFERTIRNGKAWVGCAKHGQDFDENCDCCRMLAGLVRDQSLAED